MNQNLPPNQPYPPQNYIQSDYINNGDVDLRELFSALWNGKWTILIFTVAFSIGGVGYAVSQPNVYKATAVIVSTSDSGRSGMAAMASQFGGLASLAGINIEGSGTDHTAMALAVLQSRLFINSFIHKHDLLVPLMASEKWHKSTGELELNSQLYDSTTGQWVIKGTDGNSIAPSSWQAYKKFKNVLFISKAQDTGLIELSITHHSPLLAQKWAELLIDDLNSWMKEKSLSETKRNIGYLEQQLEKTNISDMRTIFFQLIEEQTKKLMLAEVEVEFAFKIVDPPVVPEEKFGPKRIKMCILVTLLGGFIGFLVVLLNLLIKNRE